MALKTILLKGDGVSIERLANAAITPGHLIELMSTDKFRVHAIASGTHSSIVALEDENQGREIGTAYTAANMVVARYLRPGDKALMILADGQTAAIGSYLESNGNGELKVLSPASAGVSEYPRSVVGVAETAVDASDSATTSVANRRIQVTIL
jgi:hypothetical protein